METLLILLAAIVALILVIFLVVCLFLGAVFLFGWSSEQGFVGLAVYVACWVFMSPIMVTVSILVGAFLVWGFKKTYDEESRDEEK